RPELFLDRLHSFAPFDGEAYPAKILLKENFRSRPQVTDAVNYVCSQLFSPEVGGLAYGEDEALVPHRDADPSGRCGTTLLVVDQEAILGAAEDAQAAESAPRTVDETEAAVIAQEIQSLIDSGMEIPQKDGSSRPVSYGDCCILLRSFHEHAPAYEACLSRMGLPAHAAGTGDFYAASEIRLIMSLLQVIDNPMRDVPLLAVLLSPIYGFTPDDLALIRLQDRRRHLYTVLKKIALAEGELADRCAAFLREMESYRLLSATVPVDRLLRQVYETTDILHLMAVRTDGAQRVANLHLFYDQAHSFEENGFRGLSAFLRQLNRLKAHGKSQTAAVGDQRGAVQIMSVHHSKGLEFPIVFAAGLATQFNTKTAGGAMLMHADAGIGLKIIDPDTLVKREPMFYTHVKERLLRDERAEALRVLYVAMTRAREKLYLVTSLKTPQKTLQAIAADVNQTERTLSPSVVLKGKSFGDWILSAAMRHPDAAPLREIAGVSEDFPLLPAALPWRVKRIDAVTVNRAPDALPETAPEPNAALLDELLARFAYEYPYRALGQVPSKVAASDLAHRELSRAYVATARPAILNQSELTAAQRGTALHTFLQYADWAAAAHDPRQERERLVERGFLTRQQADAIDLRRVQAFFAGDLYRRIARADRMWREIPFTIEVPLTELDLPAADELASLPPGSENETMLIQGIADCVFEENGALVIVDYKTDRVRDGAELIERYHTQLQLYALALTQTLGLPVRECLLYSFALGTTFAVPLPHAEGSPV
ncbi:MAG: PD-(D/E)XK nuclease family protein, partial [Clostridia bacterium]|nr:PD-(D/E)XK nuclease family protein [Clostridia bacterium]